MNFQRALNLFLLIALITMAILQVALSADGLGKKTLKMKDRELPRTKGTIKTIKSDDGDVIDCVDIYKQPAFDHPLLANHTIQMKFSSFPSGSMSKLKITQNWHKNGRCPKGTIPIRRTQRWGHHKKLAPSFVQNDTKLLPIIDQSGVVHEHAVVFGSQGNYYGTHATINVWNPIPEDREFSLAQLWILTDNNMETIEVGWQVYPNMYGDSSTKLFVFWTSNGYHNGCYNLMCPGFVQISQNFAVGSSVSSQSTNNGEQFDISIKVNKDVNSKNWMLQLGNEVIGYWPGSLYNILAETGGSQISYGGEIINNMNGGHHTTTDMGSGHFPNEANGKASYFRDLQVVDESGTLKNFDMLIPMETNPSCYAVQVIDSTSFYFGGPGYSNECT